MNRNKTLIVAAHVDDFEIGMGGTVSKLCKDGDVFVIILCKGDRPGHEMVESHRRDACMQNCKDIGISDAMFYEYSDTRLDTVPQTDLCNIISRAINKYRPSVVYTNYSNDVHCDHRIVSSCVRVASRMRSSSTVNELYEFSIPGSTEWSHTSIHFNLFENITDHVSDKMEMISRYTTELRQPPDPISLKSIISRDMYHGSLCGYSYAEIFNIVFKRCT
jgi:LmbE family N-acetylglucosaminyl deacetylase